LPYLHLSPSRTSQNLFNFLADDYQSRRPAGIVFDRSQWKFAIAASPTQTNGFDCGVFVAVTAHLLSQNRALTHT
jgi:hypothetical protein